MKKYGFSWKRLMGITSLKRKIARKTGIPTTRGGRQRKVDRLIARSILPLVVLGVTGICGCFCLIAFFAAFQ